MHATQPDPYRRHRTDDIRCEVRVWLDAPGLGPGAAVVGVIGRGGIGAEVVVRSAEGYALCAAVNSGVGVHAVLADWIEERAGSVAVRPHRDDAAAAVAAALRRCG